jgi:hypothetical protein
VYNPANPFALWFWEVVWLMDGLPLTAAAEVYYEVDCRWLGDTTPGLYVARVAEVAGRSTITRYPKLLVA